MAVQGIGPLLGTDEGDDAARLERWFAERLPKATSVSVTGLHRLSAGHSNDTFGVDVQWREARKSRSETFVIRTRPEGPGLLEPYDVSKQYKIMAALKETKIPVPRMLWLEEDPAVLRRPFFVMEKLDGEIFDQHIPDWVLQAQPDTRRRMCQQVVETLAELHNLDWKGLGIDFLGDGVDYLSQQLDWWEAEIRKVQRGPLPAIERLLEWLRAHQPASSPRVSIVHGDTKWGNFVFQRDKLVGLFDWEMTGIGDPLVDVAWSLLTWESSPAALPGGLSRDEFIAEYEQAAGIPVENLVWYENFNTFKLAAILLRGSMLFASGESDDLRYCWFGIGLPSKVDGALRKAGIEEDLEHGAVMADLERIAEGFEYTCRTVLMPALTTSEALAQASWLPIGVRYLAATAAGKP